MPIPNPAHPFVKTAHGDFLLRDGSLAMLGNLDLATYALLTANLLLKELDSSTFALKNRADSAFMNLKLAILETTGRVKLGTDTFPEAGVHTVIDGGSTHYYPLWAQADGHPTSKTMAFMVVNTLAANTANVAAFELRLRTSSQVRTAGAFRGYFTNITDGTRTSAFNIAGARAGAFINFLRMIGGRIIIPNPTVPASAGATGEAGEIAWDANYIYVCVATNSWKRVAIAVW